MWCTAPSHLPYSHKARINVPDVPHRLSPEPDFCWNTCMSSCHYFIHFTSINIIHFDLVSELSPWNTFTSLQHTSYPIFITILPLPPCFISFLWLPAIPPARAFSRSHTSPLHLTDTSILKFEMLNPLFFRSARCGLIKKKKKKSVLSTFIYRLITHMIFYW